jgi:hypothetical protein
MTYLFFFFFLRNENDLSKAITWTQIQHVRDFLKYLWLLYLYFLFFERQNQILLFEEK